SQSKFKDVLKIKKLSKQIKDENIQLVVFHTTKNFPLMVLTKIFSGNYFKLIFMQHMHLGGSKKDIYHRWLYRKLDVWIAPLKGFKDYLLKYSGIEPDKIEVVPFGIELDRFTEHLPDKKDARVQLNLPSEKTIIGMVGRLDEKKCQHVLIEALGKLRDIGYDVSILLLGDKTFGEADKYAENLYELTEKLNLKKDVYFQDGIKEIENAYAALDIFALTTGSETFGMVLIEAMAAKLPVIATNEGGPKDIIQHNVNGLLVKPLDNDDLTEALIKLLDDKEKSNSLADSAKQTAFELYSHNKQCERLAEIFNNLLE
ncbi:glycosyltransferase family 4 protein, partial [Candidatus Zixiibacteriota bacterium]